MGAKRFKVGARGSPLSRAQTLGAIRFLEGEFKDARFAFVPFSTPGDRDVSTPIESAAPDFFTRDLDDALRNGAIDFAVHSAKDLPARVADDLDWFWLPCRADPRDALVSPKGASRLGVVGVSGSRREAYVRATLTNARPAPVRGSIDSRVQQLSDGRFDAILMAMAGLLRLYGPRDAFWRKFDVRPIPVEELAPPEGQGVLAVMFRKGDARLIEMRRRFVKAVRFVSAGVGDAGLITVRGRSDLDEADVVLSDALLGGFPLPGKDVRFVGKRCGAHSMPQEEITRLICDEARKCKRVARLKGGDAGLFGRLAEEVDALAELGIPFVVRPGVSALVAATTGTGILLTRRGESRGFTAYTPREGVGSSKEGPVRQNLVAFMATRVFRDEAKRLLRDGWAKSTPCAVVRDAAGPAESVEVATVSHFAKTGTGSSPEDSRPGLIVVGPAAAHAWPPRERVLLTCSEAVMPRAVTYFEDRGARPIPRPAIELRPRSAVSGVLGNLAEYDAVVITSPSAARIFFAMFKERGGDMRRLPKFWTCGAGTDAELRRHGVASDEMPEDDFSAKGMLAHLRGVRMKGLRVLRLRSAKAGGLVARTLRRRGAQVDDVVLYDNAPVAYDAPLPPHDAVFFASASAVEAHLAAHGAKALAGKRVYVMGEPTRSALPPAIRRRAVLVDFKSLCGL